MANIFTGNAATVTNTAVAVQLLAANHGRQYFAVALPVAGTLWVGGPGVTTTGAGRGWPVVLNQPFIMAQNDAQGGVGIYQGDLWGVATATCTASIIEISS